MVAIHCYLEKEISEFTLLGDYCQFYFISINIFHLSINTLPTSDVTKILLPITTELILLPIIT